MSLYFYICNIKVKVWVVSNTVKPILSKAFIILHKAVFSIFLCDMFVEPTYVDFLLMRDK